MYYFVVVIIIIIFIRMTQSCDINVALL